MGGNNVVALLLPSPLKKIKLFIMEKNYDNKRKKHDS